MGDQFDFLVIGDDEASLCAAASAAKCGARTAQLRIAQRKKQNAGAAAPAIPNFVWRRLDLQEYDLALEAVSARVTLFKDSDPIITYANPRQSSEALEERKLDDHFVWGDFVEEVSSLARNTALTEPNSYASPAANEDLLSLLTDPRALDRTARLYGACADLVDDYFSDERLKAHISAHALATSGEGDCEIGSARAVAEFLDEDAWRVRAPRDAIGVMSVLEQVAKDAGVAAYTGKITDVSRDGAKHVNVSIGAENIVKTRYVFFATPDAALAAGVASERGGALHANFTVRFKLSNRIEPPAGDEKSIFEIIDDGSDIRSAREAAVKGRLYDRAPVEFEFTPNGEVIAHTAYFPAAFYEDGAWRGWTGQDRQAAAAIIKNRVAARLPDFADAVRRTETEVVTPTMRRSLFNGCDRVIIQPNRHNAISAAVSLIDQVISRDE